MNSTNSSQWDFEKYRQIGKQGLEKYRQAVPPVPTEPVPAEPAVPAPVSQPQLEWRAGHETLGEKIRRLAETFAYGIAQHGTKILPFIERIMKTSEQKAIEEGRMEPKYAQWQTPSTLEEVVPEAKGTVGEKITEAAGGITGALLPIGAAEATLGRLGIGALTRVAPEFAASPSLAARLATAAARGIPTGAGYGAGMAALEGKSPAEIAREAAISGAFFGAGVPAGELAEAAARRILPAETIASRLARAAIRGGAAGAAGTAAGVPFYPAGQRPTAEDVAKQAGSLALFEAVMSMLTGRPAPVPRPEAKAEPEAVPEAPTAEAPAAPEAVAPEAPKPEAPKVRPRFPDSGTFRVWRGLIELLGPEGARPHIEEGYRELGHGERAAELAERFIRANYRPEIAEEEVAAGKPEAVGRSQAGAPSVGGSMTSKVVAMPVRPSGMEISGEGEAPARQAIVNRLEKILDIPLRVGRYQEKAAGIYKSREEVIRTKLAEDLPVIAHEAGHHLDKVLGLADPAFDAELLKLGWAASNPPYHPARVRKEGVAEFTRLYLGDREAAQREAPNFYDFFGSKLSGDPRLESALKQAQEQIHAYLRADPVSRVKAAVSFGFDRPEREPLNVKERVKSLWQGFYTKIFDELKPLHDTVQTITGGKEIPAPEDPYKQAVLLRDNGRLAYTFIWKGQIDENYNVVGPSLKEIIAPLNTKEKYRDFGAYVTAKRVKELYRQKAAGRDIKAFPFSEADADATIQRLKNPEFDQIHEQLKGWFKNLVGMLERSGLVSPEAKAKILASSEEYVPLYRAFEEEERFGKRRLANLPQPVKGLKGSGRTVVDPIESAVRQAYVFTNLAMRNNVNRLLVELAEKFPGAGKFIEEIPGDAKAISFKLSEIKNFLEQAGVDTSGTDLDKVAAVFRAGQIPRAKPDEHIITVWREGKPKFYQVSKELYDISTGANTAQLHWFLNLLRYPTNLLRAGATLTIDFALRNPLRDLGSAFVYEGIMPWDLLKAIAHMAKKSDIYAKWKAAGGDQATFWTVDRDYLKRDVRRLIERSWRDQLKHGVLHPIDALYKIREWSENITRMATFGRKLGWEAAPAKEAIDEAALASRDVTVDFRRFGTWGRDWNAASAFANAALQGWDKFLRQLKKDPLGVFLRAFGLVTLPSVGLFFVNKDNPYYQELPQWRKDLFWNIPIDGGRRFLMWPKPFEVGILFGTIPERFLQWAVENDPQAFAHLGDTVFSTLPGILPTVFEAPLELWANKSFFTGLPIVPMREQKLEPALQYGPYTSETAKLLGKKLGWSPRKIEQFIQSTAATWGRYALGISDAILEAAGITQPVPKPEKGPEEKMVLRSFVTRPKAGQSTSVEQFYDIYERGLKLEASAKEQIKSGQRVRFTEEEKKLLRSLPKLKEAAKALSETRNAIRAVQESPKYTPERKRRLIDALEMREINITRHVLGKEAIK